MRGRSTTALLCAATPLLLAAAPPPTRQADVIDAISLSQLQGRSDHDRHAGVSGPTGDRRCPPGADDPPCHRCVRRDHFRHLCAACRRYGHVVHRFGVRRTFRCAESQPGAIVGSGAEVSPRGPSSAQAPTLSRATACCSSAGSRSATSARTPASSRLKPRISARRLSKPSGTRGNRRSAQRPPPVACGCLCPKNRHIRTRPAPSKIWPSHERSPHSLHRRRSVAVPRRRQARQTRDNADQADGDAARPFARVFAGRCRSGARDRGRSRPRLRLHGQGKSRRRHLQRHGDPWPWRFSAHSPRSR